MTPINAKIEANTIIKEKPSIKHLNAIKKDFAAIFQQSYNTQHHCYQLNLLFPTYHFSTKNYTEKRRR